MSIQQKESQTGWEFRGADITSTHFSKKHYFPAGVSTDASTYDRREHGDEIIQPVTGRNYRYGDEEDKELPKCFQVYVVETYKGKVIGQEAINAKPYIGTVTYYDEEPDEKSYCYKDNGNGVCEFAGKYSDKCRKCTVSPYHKEDNEE